MKSIVAALMLIAATAYAAAGFEDVLRAEVAQDIQGLADDTVNEGETSAHVVYTKKVPNVDCVIRNNKSDAKLKWAFCSVEFRVTYAGDQQSSATRSCNLVYSFSPEDVANTLTRGKDDNFSTCIEWLGESLE